MISLKWPKQSFPQIREQALSQPLWRVLEWLLLSSSWWFCGGDSEPATTLWRDSVSFYSMLMHKFTLKTSDSLGRGSLGLFRYIAGTLSPMVISSFFILKWRKDKKKNMKETVNMQNCWKFSKSFLVSYLLAYHNCTQTWSFFCTHISKFREFWCVYQQITLE